MTCASVNPELITTRSIAASMAANGPGIDLWSASIAMVTVDAFTPAAARSNLACSAAVGAGIGEVAEMSESTGTVLACVNFTDKYQPADEVCISPWKGGRFCQLTFHGNGAGSLEWYQRNFANENRLA